MDIYEKIDAIFGADVDVKPQWAEEILSELQDIKRLLIEQKVTSTPSLSQHNRLYEFIKVFRTSMKADDTKTFIYKNRRLGVNDKGLLYDKYTKKLLSKNEAFSVYRYAYKNKDKLSLVA